MIIGKRFVRIVLSWNQYYLKMYSVVNNLRLTAPFDQVQNYFGDKKWLVFAAYFSALEFEGKNTSIAQFVVVRNVVKDIGTV